MKAFQAYGADGAKVTRPTPREAASAFFEQNPTKRKCDIVEGTIDGHFFTVRYGRSSEGDWPQSWKDVTKRTVHVLPETVTT